MHSNHAVGWFIWTAVIGAVSSGAAYTESRPVIDAGFWQALGSRFEFTPNREVLPTITEDAYNDALCAEQFNRIIEGISGAELWSLKMIDSWGKIPSGILSGNLYSLGQFDECLAVRHQDVDEPPLQAQYCLAEMYTKPEGLPLTRELQNPIKAKGMDTRMMGFQHELQNDTMLTIYLGICVPETCSPDMIVQMMDQLADKVQLPVAASVTSQMCSRAEPKALGALDVITLAFLTMVAASLLLCTSYDIMWQYRGFPGNPFVRAFSLYTNGRKLFHRQTDAGSSHTMSCLHGVRVLSIVWVIFGHTYMIMVIGPLTNAASVLKWVEHPYSMFLLSATVSVDSFFMISGLLVTWTMLKYLDQSNGKINVLWLYLHRYIRLTPSLAAAVLICSSLIRHFGAGPLWNMYLNAADLPCQNYWWSTLLYVQNYANPSQMCMSHSWYLSVDMQLYVLSPLLIYPLWRWKLKALGVIPVLTLGSMAATIAILLVNQFSVRMATTMLGGRRMELVYYTTHCRMGAWLVGVLLGYVLHKYRGKTIHCPKVWVCVGWTLCIGTFLAVIFANYPLQVPSYPDSILGGAFYESISRVVWSAALAWLVFACVHGYGGPVNWFLSLPGWQPLARMSYAIYLVHLPIQLVLAAQVRVAAYFSDTTAIIAFWGTLGVTLFISAMWTLAFESPIIAIERVLLSTPNAGSISSTQTRAASQTVLVGDGSSTSDGERGTGNENPSMSKEEIDSR